MINLRDRRIVRSFLSFVLAGVLSTTYLSETVMAVEQGPIDIGQVAAKSFIGTREQIKRRAQDLIDGKVQTKEAIPNFMARALSSNSWMITRGLLYGVTGIDAAIAVLREQSTLNAQLVPKWAGEYATLYLNKKNSGEAIPDLNGFIDKKEAELNAALKNKKPGEGSYWGTGDISNIAVSLGNMAASMEALKEHAGFFGTGSGGGRGAMFDKLVSLGIILITIAGISKIAWIAYQAATGQTQNPAMDMMHTFIKAALLAAVVASLENIIFYGISMSDAVRDYIASNDASGENVFELVGKLIEAKLDLLRLNDGGWASLLAAPATAFVETILSWAAYYIAAATLYVLLLLSDITMALSAVMAPFVFACALFPTCEGWIGQWIKSYITILFWGPLASIYGLVLVIILSVSFDTSFLSFFVIMLGYIMGASQVPNVAKSMGGAAMVGVAAGIASMPQRAIKSTATAGLSAGAAAAGAGIGAARAAGKAASGAAEAGDKDPQA